MYDPILVVVAGFIGTKHKVQNVLDEGIWQRQNVARFFDDLATRTFAACRQATSSALIAATTRFLNFI